MVGKKSQTNTCKMSEIGKSLDTDVYIITAGRHLDKHEHRKKTGQTCVKYQTEGKSKEKTKQTKCVNCQRPKESETNSTQADKGVKRNASFNR